MGSRKRAKLRAIAREVEKQRALRVAHDERIPTGRGLRSSGAKLTKAVSLGNSYRRDPVGWNTGNGLANTKGGNVV